MTLSIAFDITDKEREFLLDLLGANITALLRELHHTDARDYKSTLRQRLELAEVVRTKIEDSGRADGQ